MSFSKKVAFHTLGCKVNQYETEGIKEEDFVLFLTHNPEYFEEMTEDEKQKADITLAGHTHGGQVTFFGKNYTQSELAQISKFGSGSSSRSFFGPIA
ncbi:MAG: hypothetical protein ACFNPZ_12430, partial [Fusobacterium polymorphum]